MQHRQFRLLTIFFCLFLLNSTFSAAQDAKELEKQFNAKMRSAQSAFFNGKLEESAAGLKESKEILESLKKLDPEHRQIKTFENKLAKQQKDLDRKLGKSADSKASESAAKNTPSKTPAVRKLSKLLPRLTAMEVSEIRRTLDSLEGFEKDKMGRMQNGESLDNIERSFTSIREKIDSLQPQLEQARGVAAKEEATEHPDFLAVIERVEKVSIWAENELKVTREKTAGLLAAKASAEKSVENLKKLWEDYENKYFREITNLSYQDDLEKISEAFVLIGEWTKKKPEVEQVIASFEKEFGNSRDEIEKSTGTMQAVYPWENFKKALEEMENIPKRLAQTVNGKIEMEISALESRHDFYRLEGHATIRKLEDFCKKHVKDYKPNPSLPKLLADDVKKLESKVAKRVWPACKGASGDRAGALEYFKNTWGKDEKRPYTVLGTVVTGDWSVQKKDIHGKPIMYGLPVLLAAQRPEDKEHGLARVFILTVRTPESAGAKMSPPFSSDTVGDSYFIHASKIK